ncbi:type III secretion system export apparatus subunit SctS [Stenotrophomonas sp. Sa5BUN4]|jgi:type III secretion system export apparatus protein|uniref:Type III secretion system export apparatus subunit SctS n=1 Tax=Stenotrophomonas lacuserhaii TaxID=2760084 RepID=A0A8X8FX74_9GAMM|nr:MULTISPECIES: type III secretion system export apparatus subunit SctS [Stenotrophomonas]KIP87799.1 type III secretion system protein SpaQ [Stenotrophomonas maltophilia]MBD7954552.1 type III secretion system export apparatus subunit SctS [Stenotrophomonas pennii]MBD8644936.1 type III secretion system export apparatus subunit SctS [Stenotrophomonas sp. CFBP 13724]MDY1034421.1 type III secretion system export apparatus subunit SctS [Stenotrophomonas sp. CFBP8980]
MNELITIGNKTLMLVLLLSAGPVAVATVVGLLIGLFQTVTQLQEQTLPFGAKMLAVVLTVLVLLGWMSRMLIDFGILVFTRALGV